MVLEMLTWWLEVEVEVAQVGFLAQEALVV
jgi:hypothetical protein